MRFKLALAFLLICGSGFADQNKKVQDEILAMVEEDQMARARISDFINISDQDRQTLHEIATKHNQQIKKIISNVGWPGIGLVGIEGAEGMWLLIQHQDKDIAFQKQCLVLLKEAVDKQDAQYREYAYLLDRIRKSENLPQIYGTQWEFKEGKCFLYPVEAPEQLNQRRFEAGLNSIEEYAEEMKRIFRLNDRDIFYYGSLFQE